MAMGSNTTQIFEGILFRMRPCTTRSRLKKAIEAYGGRFIKPGEKALSIINLTDDQNDNHGIYIDFITVSVQKKKLEPMEKYDLSKPKMASSVMGVDGNSLAKARQAYQPEEDEAILQYVTLHGREFGTDGSVGGNLLWTQMEKEGVTSHTWQSMKSRYNTHLQHRAPSFPYQPLTIRNCGDSTVSYAVSRDSPMSSEVESTVPIAETKTYKRKGGATKKIKKLYNRDNINIFAKTPDTKKRSDETIEDSSQHISEVSSTDTSGTSQEHQKSGSTEEPENESSKSLADTGTLQQQQNSDRTEEPENESSKSHSCSKNIDLFQSFSGDTSCDGIIREINIQQQQESEINKEQNDDDDETQLIIESPQQNLRLQPRHTSTVSKNDENSNNTTPLQKSDVEISPEFTESDEEESNNDDFDKELFAQAIQLASQHDNSYLEKRQQNTKVTKRKIVKNIEEQEEDHEFKIAPCKCAASKDYSKALKIVDSLNNLPSDFNWTAVYKDLGGSDFL